MGFTCECGVEHHGNTRECRTCHQRNPDPRFQDSTVTEQPASPSIDRTAGTAGGTAGTADSKECDSLPNTHQQADDSASDSDSPLDTNAEMNDLLRSIGEEKVREEELRKQTRLSALRFELAELRLGNKVLAKEFTQGEEYTLTVNSAETHSEAFDMMVRSQTKVPSQGSSNQRTVNVSVSNNPGARGPSNAPTSLVPGGQQERGKPANVNIETTSGSLQNASERQKDIEFFQSWSASGQNSKGTQRRSSYDTSTNFTGRDGRGNDREGRGDTRDGLGQSVGMDSSLDPNKPVQEQVGGILNDNYFHIDNPQPKNGIYESHIDNTNQAVGRGGPTIGRDGPSVGRDGPTGDRPADHPTATEEEYRAFQHWRGLQQQKQQYESTNQ